MFKLILKDFLKIIVGFILSQVIFLLVNFLIGVTFSKLSENNLISMEKSAELLDSFLITYLAFIFVFIILSIMIFRNYVKDEKRELIWKIILLMLVFSSFEFLGN